MAVFNTQPSPFAPLKSTAVRPPTQAGGMAPSGAPSAGTPTNQAQPRPPGQSPQQSSPQQRTYPNSPNPGASGSDPRGRVQNQGNYQQQRYEGQIDPLISKFAEDYGRGSAQGFQDYGNIMRQYGDVSNLYGDVADQYKGLMGPSGYGGIMDRYSKMAGPEGYGEFAKTGGYSPTDISGMRARGVSPIRAAYSNAEREVGRQRSLQGGYSPNATATLAKMAREQGQAGSDAATNVEANLAQMKQSGRLAGMQGQMSSIQGMGNTMQGMGDAVSGIAGTVQGRGNVAQGMTGLYGSTPGMASTFGNQLLNSTNQSGNFGMNLMGNDISGQQLPGQWDTTASRIGDVANMAYPFLDYFSNRNKDPNQTGQQPTQPGQIQVPAQGTPNTTTNARMLPGQYDFPTQGRMYQPGPTSPIGVNSGMNTGLGVPNPFGPGSSQTQAPSPQYPPTSYNPGFPNPQFGQNRPLQNYFQGA